MLSGASLRPDFPALHVGRQRLARARGVGASGSGTCQNTGPRGVKSSPQWEGVWAPPPGELINWRSSQMNPQERLAMWRSKARGRGKGGCRWEAAEPGSRVGDPPLLPLGSARPHDRSPCTDWAQGPQGQHEREGLPCGASNLSAMKAEDPKIRIGGGNVPSAPNAPVPSLWVLCLHTSSWVFLTLPWL